MAASKKIKKEFPKEVQMSSSRLQELRRDKVKHKLAADAPKESEEHARVFASYQHAVSQLRKFYVREVSFRQMLQETVDLFVKSFGYYMAWYGELELDEKVIIPLVWAGKYEKYLDGLRLELDDSRDAKCAMSLAIVNKEPFGYADLEQDKDFEKWRQLALKYGYRSNLAIPLIIDGKSVGAFLIYSTRPRAFSEDLIRHLGGITNELAPIVESITERKKTEGALRESEEKYRSIFNTAANLITSVDRNGVIVDCNARIRELLGYQRDEVIGQSIAKIIHPDYMQQARACLNEMLVDGIARHKEYKMVRKDSEIIDVEINAAGVKDREGKYVGGICIVEDITERKEAEEAVYKRTEELTVLNEMAIELAGASSTVDVYKLVCEKLKGITGALLTCVTSYDSQKQELKIEHISADSKLITKANKLLGQKVKDLRIPLESRHIEEMLSEKAKRLDGLYELMLGAIPKTVVNVLKKTLRIGDVYGLLLHYDDKIIGTMPVLMPQQRPSLSIEVLKAFANLASTSLQRMKAEEERVAAVQERAAVVDAMPDSLVVISLEGKILSCNPAHLEMTGHSCADEISGRDFSELREAFCDPEKDIPRMMEVFKNILQNGSCKPIEVRVRRVDGKELMVSASCSLQRDAMGNPLNVVAILRDITPQKQLQKMEREAAVTRMAVETIEGMLEGVVIMDLDGTIRQVNSEFERRSGYKRQEVVGRKSIELGIISKQETQKIEKEIIPKLMHEGLVRNVEMVTMSRDGTRIPVLMSWRLIKDAQGNPKSIITTATDITERKRAEEKLLEYQERLRSMTSELSLIEERERRRIATELHDRIVQPLVFSKMKLDELSAPTTSVDSGKPLEEISDMLDQVVQETQTLTYDLGSPTLYELGLESAIEEWLTEEVEQKHDVATFFEDDGAPKPLSQDISALLFRAVRELLVNVIKHARAQNIKISLRREGNRIRICVADDGIGFELSDRGISKDRKGGYGIFSIKEQLNHIGGYLDIESEPDQGTRVVLMAPLKENDPATGG